MPRHPGRFLLVSLLAAAVAGPPAAADGPPPKKGQRRTGGIINNGGISARPLPFAARGRHADMNGDPLPDHVLFRAGGARLRHGGPVTCVAWSPDGTRVVSGGHDGTVAVWDAATGRQLLQLDHAPDAFVNCVAVSADGTMLASGGSSVVLWDLATGERLDRFTPPGPDRERADLAAVSFAAGAARLAAAWEDDTVRVWDVAAEGALREIREHPALGRRIALSADGSSLAVARKTELSVVDVSTGKPRREPPVPDTLDAADGVERIDERTGQPPRPPSEICAVAYAPDGALIATRGHDHDVRVWDVATGGQVLALEVDDQVEAKEGWAPQTAVAFSPDGRRLVATGFMTVVQWEVATGRRLLAFEGHDEHPVHGGIIHGVAYSPDGSRLATASRDETVRFWDAATGVEERPFFEFAAAPTAAVIAPDGTWIAVGVEGDALIHRFDLTTGKPLEPITAHPAGVRRLAVSPDGAVLVSTGDDDDRIILWDAATGNEIRTLRGQAGKDSYGVAFAPAGDRLATWSGRDGLVIWEPATGTELARVPPGKPRKKARMIPYEQSVVFHPDGKHVAVICAEQGQDNVVRTPILLFAADGSLVREFDTGPDEPPAPDDGPDGKPHSDQPRPDADTHYTRLWFMPDGETLVAGGFQTTSYFEVTSGTWIRATSDGGTIALAPDGKTLAVADPEGVLRLGRGADDIRFFDTATGKQGPGLHGHGTHVTALHVSAAGRRLVTAGEDRTAYVWDLTVPRDAGGD